MKVGDKIWYFDSNRRRYPPTPPGSLWAGGGPIWREHWRLVEITGDTSVSWVTAYGKAPKRGGDIRWAFTEAEVDDRSWVNDNAYRIGNKVGGLHDPALLREIARLIGYEPR